MRTTRPDWFLPALACLAVAGTLPGQAAPAGSALRKKLARIPGLEWQEAAGKVFFAVPDAGRFDVVAASQRGEPVISDGAQRVRLTRRALWQPKRRSNLKALGLLLARARAAKAVERAFLLDHNPLLGPYLRSDRRCLFGKHVLARFALPPRAPVRLAPLAKAFLPDLDRSALSARGCKALSTVLSYIGGDTARDEGPEPELLRNLVRDGWLRGFCPDSPHLEALETGVRRALAVKPRLLYRAGDTELALWSNDFGAGGWVLRDSKATQYLTVVPHTIDLPARELLVELPARSRPIADAGKAVAAKLFLGNEVASWSKTTGLHVDEGAWRRAFQRSRPQANVVRNYRPPHIPILTLDHTPVLLATKFGTLAAPRSDTTAGREFVRAAARTLRGPAYLDLIRVYFFSYVNDSPDNHAPFLTGTESARGEIHQTVEQTLSTTTSGVFRGDCDDLAEVFQAIVARQGHIGHIMQVPRHNAFAFCEQSKTGSWTTYVLHTGRPLAFRHRDLPKSLERAYKHFGRGEGFDPASIPIALRFSGENTRSAWWLGYRIFSEPDYAATMIDVQRDWHYHTYRRAIDKMEQLVAGGDTDTANLTELAGLSERTGQPAKAAAYLERAMQGKDDPVLQMGARRLADLYDAKQNAAAKKLATFIWKERLPEIRRKQGPAFWQIALNFVDTVVGGGKDYELGVQILAGDLGTRIRRMLAAVERMLDQTRIPPRAWREAPQLQPIRNMLRSYVGTVIFLHEKAGKDPRFAKQLALMRKDVDAWIRHVSPIDRGDPAEAAWNAAIIGRWHRALATEDFDRRVAAAPLPVTVSKKVRKRSTLAAELPRDLSSIRASVPYWFNRMSELFSKEKKKVDTEALEDFVGRIRVAHAAAGKLGLDSMQFDLQLHLANLALAIMKRSEENVRALLAHVADENDKRLRDSTAAWIGASARFVEKPWFGRLIDLWTEELRYKPSYFEIAWGAVQNEAPGRALIAGERAVRVFTDDPSFAEEYAFMKRLLGAK